MKHYLLLLLSTIFVNNFVLVKFLGLCPFLGVSRKIKSALSMGLATTFVLSLASVSSYLLYNYLLVPLELQYLRTISFIVVIAVLVQLTEIIIHYFSPALHRVLGLYLPLITTNCAVLGVALLNIQAEHNLLESLFFGIGTAMGFTLVLVLFAALRERIDVADVPRPFQGASIGLITAGLMAMAFMGFTGLA